MTSEPSLVRATATRAIRSLNSVGCWLIILTPHLQIDSNRDWNKPIWGPDPAEALRKIQAVSVVSYFQGLRPTTTATYGSGVFSYEFFCRTFDFKPYPASDDALMYFCTWSAARISVDSISNYLSAIRSRHVDLGLEWKERLQRLLAGIAWSQHQEKKGRIRLPITVDMLSDVLTKMRALEEETVAVTGNRPSIYSISIYALFRAITSTLLLGLLRPSEGVVRHTGTGVVTEPLRLAHLVWHHTTNPDGSTEVDGCQIPLS